MKTKTLINQYNDYQGISEKLDMVGWRFKMNEAIVEQPKPHGTGREIDPLVQQDILTRQVLVPEHGLITVALWIRSAAAYLKIRQLENKEFPIIASPPTLEVAKALSDDLEARARLGEERYGERLRAFNGRDARIDAYQEILDAWKYLRQDEEENEVGK